MVYMGSKQKLAGELVPIIQKYIDDNNIENYLEAFVGGANIIDKIKCRNRYGSDVNKYLIALLKQAQEDCSVFPDDISEEEYKRVRDNKNNYPDWYVGLVGFCGTFSARFFGGFVHDKSGKRNRYKECLKNLKKQASLLKNITFNCCDFRDINDSLEGFVIYCDIPYKGTTKYSNTNKFPYEEFYEWATRLAQKNIVLISEYSMPDDGRFEVIWQKQVKALNDCNRVAGDKNNERIEKLFICKKGE